MTEEYWLELAAEALADTALTTRFNKGHSVCADLPEVRRATGFAAWKHTGQFRKGEGKTPYIHHPIEVAAILSEAGAVTKSGTNRTRPAHLKGSSIPEAGRQDFQCLRCCVQHASGLAC